VLAAADVFVQPSLSEGLPLALLEAMFAARAIVATAVGEVGAALDHGRAGVLVPPGDAPALAAALDGLLTSEDRARTLGRRARERAAAEYDLSHMVRRYRTIYDELLAGLIQPFPVHSTTRLTGTLNKGD
jgi:glycosyltransferase involved in cell wall biosynthesis